MAWKESRELSVGSAIREVSTSLSEPRIDATIAFINVQLSDWLRLGIPALLLGYLSANSMIQHGQSLFQGGETKQSASMK